MSNATSNVTTPPCECAKGGKKIDGACEPSKKEQQAFKKEQEERNDKRKKYNDKLKSGGKVKKGKHEKEIYRVRNKTWKDTHCQKVLFDYEMSEEDVKKKLETVKEEMEKLQDDFEEVLYDKGIEFVEDKVTKVVGVAGCAGAGAVIGGIIGFFFGGVGAAPGAVLGGELGASLCGAAATADTVLDTIEGAVDIWNNKDAIADRIAKLKGAIESVDELKQNVEDLANLEGEEKRKKKEEIYDKITESVNNDPCLKARRCQLIPYKNNTIVASQAKGATPMDKAFKLDQKKGCCPGQRAHHIIPETKFDGCDNYTKEIHNGAPTVCAEGGHSSGTHGKLHGKTDDNTDKMVNGEYEHTSTGCNGNASSLKCTIEASSDAFVKTFKGSKCKKKCIKEQLEKYYKDLGCTMVPKNKNGKVINPAEGATETNDGL